MKELIVKRCEKCGAMVEVLKEHDNSVIMCCGEKMDILVPNSFDASREKHMPSYERVEDEIFVKVNHVMEKGHYIEWILMLTDDRVCKVMLYPEQGAECRFKYVPGSKIYAYCNKHGLWCTDVK